MAKVTITLPDEEYQYLLSRCSERRKGKYVSDLIRADMEGQLKLDSERTVYSHGGSKKRPHKKLSFISENPKPKVKTDHDAEKQPEDSEKSVSSVASEEIRVDDNVAASAGKDFVPNQANEPEDASENQFFDMLSDFE